MEYLLPDPVLLSRIQFAVTASFHILWPIVTIGVSLFLVVIELLWLKTRDPDYYYHARFWSKLFLLNFTIGVVSGIPLEFEFGTNWTRFSSFSGEFFGNILGFEGAMAFMLEAGFLGIMLFGWMRVTPGIHFFSTCMVMLGASLSALWILIANAWMQTPAGGHIENGHFRVDNYFEAIFNPNMPQSFSHMWLACLETSLFVIGGISAWYIYRKKHPAFFLKSFKVALIAAVAIAPLQIAVGDLQGRDIYQTQPVKGAAIEAHWETNPPGTGAPWNLLAWPDKEGQKNTWAIQLPNVLSILATASLQGRVLGLKEFPGADRPSEIGTIFYTFRIMVGIGFFFLGLMLWTMGAWVKGKLTLERVDNNRFLLRAWIASIPLGYLATECGWMVRELGRQPWAVYGLLRTQDAASLLPVTSVAVSLTLFVAVYLLLLAVFLIFAVRIIRKGPDMTLALPTQHHPANAGLK
jgi:cytochrome d ubiquinol oxidase subunit I